MNQLRIPLESFSKTELEYTVRRTSPATQGRPSRRRTPRRLGDRQHLRCRAGRRTNPGGTHRDSIGMLALVDFIENRYAIEFMPREIDVYTLDTVERIESLIHAKQSGRKVAVRQTQI